MDRQVVLERYYMCTIIDDDSCRDFIFHCTLPTHVVMISPPGKVKLTRGLAKVPRACLHSREEQCFFVAYRVSVVGVICPCIRVYCSSTHPLNVFC